MKRRDFLTSMGAMGLVPMLPSASLAKFAKVAPAYSVETYDWATVLVRAHNYCSTAMLQRNLGIEPAAASLMKKQLIKNGIVTAETNAYGMHRAVSPLIDDSLMRPNSYTSEPKRQTENESAELAFVELGGGAQLPMNNAQRVI